MRLPMTSEPSSTQVPRAGSESTTTTVGAP